MENLPYTVLIDELPEKTMMRFSGQLIINHIEKITATVKNGLISDKDLQIEVDNPESVDVTFIQLLLALKATLSANGKKVEVNAELSEDIKKLILNSGFQYVLN
ncbi:STAS domain-containing protein [Carboxylicivirga sediminis]|uniref:STAS domain-containing protein n=1 Tax=Carboxylicivirga sediminis TaxID=2006564 RepID=A0A941IZ03_9BACT|nr:STAS domain-containing protein [Carboxylicivirga sediminis]MBR8537044.1 STAS domain-containing protein [Carboxylicivirga sediminis]